MKQEIQKSRVLVFFAAGLILTTAGGCSQSGKSEVAQSAQNRIEGGDPTLLRRIGDSQHSFVVMGHSTFKAKVSSGEIDPTHSLKAIRTLNGMSDISENPDPAAPNLGNSDGTPITSNSLIFGLPFNLLKKPMIFGSVITQVEDPNNLNLGNLKLADIPSFQVKLKLNKNQNHSFMVSILDCGQDCSHSTSTDPLLELPVQGLDLFQRLVFVDLSALGTALDLTAIRKGDPFLTQFKSKSSQTARFDYTNGTLVFDVVTQLENQNPNLSPEDKKEASITNRWFLKTESPFNQSFNSRPAAPGVGFFMTEKSPSPLIERWDFDKKKAREGIKYYLKHVPAQFQESFASSFDEWNSQLLPIVGKKIFDYEFIPENDPRNELLVTGDVRYNIVEWDLINKASYGGLGPSIANQYSGEIFHANVLIQGPRIIELYTKWFNINKAADGLRLEGRSNEADKLISTAILELSSKKQPSNKAVFNLNFGKNIQVRVRSQDPALEDPLQAKEGFDPIPVGYTYDSYMNGYFHDMLTHELGHNIGLRHNFKGSLGASNSQDRSIKVSRSVMEYLGRGYRQLDHVGAYDLMAISYGYSGIQPDHTDWFCTDEDAANLNDPTKSAECTPNDATDDPVTHYQAQLSRAIDLLLAKGETESPDWTVSSMNDQLTTTLNGLGAYAVSAEHTSSNWINFFNKPGRPIEFSKVKDYILIKIKDIICDKNYNLEIELKSSDSGKAKARDNLSDLMLKTSEILKVVYSSEDLKCSVN